MGRVGGTSRLAVALRSGSNFKDHASPISQSSLETNFENSFNCSIIVRLLHLCSVSIDSPSFEMTISRSVVSLLRTSRLSLSQSKGVNPVYRVLGHDRFAARTYATAFTRDKPHVNIGE